MLRLWRVHRHPQVSSLKVGQLSRAFKVLAVESSADDTCVAVVTSSREILSNVVIKQSKQLEEYGGIHPYSAIQAHQRALPFAVQQALAEAKLRAQDVDGIAFTRGPGIGGCLSVSANAAKTLAAALGKPIVGVHHMQAHALTPLLTSTSTNSNDHLAFPYLSLLISGGHTLLVLTRSPNPKGFEILATTADTSIGNCFDKVAKALGIPPHPDGLGLGAALERYCELHPMSEADVKEGSKKHDLKLAIPLRKQLKFSYAGLYSEVQRSIDSAPRGDEDESRRYFILLAHAFQQIAIEQLEEKLGLALDVCGAFVKHVVISGGVASNKYLRSRLADYLNRRDATHTRLVYPPAHLCTDNAAMIAWASMYRFLAGEKDNYDVDLRPVWPINEE